MGILRPSLHGATLARGDPMRGVRALTRGSKSAEWLSWGLGAEMEVRNGFTKEEEGDRSS